MLLKIDKKTGDSVLVQDCIFVSEEFWLASVSRSRHFLIDRDDKWTAQLGVLSWGHFLWRTHFTTDFLIFEFFLQTNDSLMLFLADLAIFIEWIFELLNWSWWTSLLETFMPAPCPAKPYMYVSNWAFTRRIFQQRSLFFAAFGEPHVKNIKHLKVGK